MKIKICALLGSLFYTLTFLVGKSLDVYGNVKVSIQMLLTGVVLFTILFFLLCKIFNGVYLCTANAGMLSKRTGERKNAKALWSYPVIMLAAWLIVFLAVYPGFFAYDAMEEVAEVTSGEYVSRHPLLHVLLLGNIVSSIQQWTGDYNKGIAVYVLFQMLICGVTFVWVLKMLGQLGCPRWGVRLSVIYWAFFPTVVMFVLCTSKDTPYTLGLLVLMTCMMMLAIDPESIMKSRTRQLLLALGIWMTGMFRNNGVYVMITVIPMLWVLCAKQHRKRIVLLGLAAVLLCTGARKTIDAVLEPENTDTMESLTVPIQQLARVYTYNPEKFTEQELEVLYEILPPEALECYNPKLSDLVKVKFQTEQYGKDPARYRKLWFSMLKKAPMTYLNAWLMTSYGFWYPFTVIDVYNGMRHYAESSYFSCETEPPGTRHSFIPLLEKIYEYISWRQTVHQIPVISWVFSMGFWCWIYVFVMLCMIVCGQWKLIAAILPAFMNWGTVLLGPTYLIRYVLIFFFAVPILAFAFLYTLKTEVK